MNGTNVNRLLYYSYVLVFRCTVEPIAEDQPYERYLFDNIGAYVHKLTERPHPPFSVHIVIAFSGSTSLCPKMTYKVDRALKTSYLLGLFGQGFNVSYFLIFLHPKD